MVKEAADNELPPLFKRHVRRPRLTKILDQSTAQAILIIAPPGYGKTTLVAEWLQGREDVGWYRATTASADIAAFSADLVEVIQPIAPGAGTRVLQRIQVPESPERLADVLADLLAEDIQDWPGESWIVVDDYHLVAESLAVEQFVDRLLALSQLRLLVTSRLRPRWASARRSLYGEVFEITRDDLAMTDREVLAVLGSPRDGRAASIMEQAEGWPALVGLASLTDSILLPSTDVSDALYRYFAEEILRNSTDATRQALFELACTPHLADDYLSVLTVPQEDISTVILEQPLVLTHQAGSRRLHPLLREFLRRRFARDDPAAHGLLCQRLISQARQLGSWGDAFELAIETGDMRTAVEIACESGPTLLEEGRHETLDRWLTLCGDATSMDPEALLLHAEARLRLGKLIDAYGLACEVAPRFGSKRLASRSWRLRGRASYWLAENERALHEYLEAIEASASTTERMESLWGAFLAAQQLDHPEAAAYLDQLEELSPLDPPMRLRLAVGRSVWGQRRGTFRGAHDIMQASAGFLNRTADPEAQSSFLAHWAYVEINRARYDDARELAARAADSARLLRLGLPMHSCLACQALAEAGLRKFSNSDRLLAEMRRLGQEQHDPTLHLQTRMVELKLKISRGASLSRWSYEEPLSPSDPSAGEFLALQGLVAALRGEADKALALSKRATQISATAECILYSAFAQLIVTVPRLPASAATERLAQVVASAVERDCLDAYVLAYRGEPSLLRLAADSSPIAAITTELIQRARDQTLGSSAGLSAPASEPLHDVLTRRELEVFALLSEGLSNQDIAKRLVVSPSTAKVHVHNIMRKLGVRSRVEAILRFGTSEDL